MDSDVGEGRDAGRGKRGQRRDSVPSTRVEIDGSKRIFSELVAINICGPRARARRCSFKTVYETIPWTEPITTYGVSAKSLLVQYHPFFDFDLANKTVKRDPVAWKCDVNRAVRELERAFGTPPTVFTREPVGGIHAWYPDLRISSDHLTRVYAKLVETIGVQLQVLSLDVGIQNFPMPRRSKDGKTFYTSESGECEPHPIASGTEAYAHTIYDGHYRLQSVTKWVPPQVFEATFDKSHDLHQIVAKIIEATGGAFRVSQVLQHLMHYPASFMPNICSFLAALYPDTFNVRMRSISDLLGWNNVEATPRRHSVNDIFTSIAIRMFRTPDPGIGDVVSIDTIAKLSFRINGYFMALLKEEQAKQALGENFCEFDAQSLLPRASTRDMVETIVVFYQDQRSRVKLFTGTEWAAVNRDAVLLLLTMLGVKESATQTISSRISGRYCQLALEQPDSSMVYLAGGGYYLYTPGARAPTVTQFIDPLDAPSPAFAKITFDEMNAVRGDAALQMVQHITSDASLSGECECSEWCTSSLARTALAVASARYVYKLMCCRGPLTRYVLQLFAKICFKLDRKNIIVLLGETAGNGKTEFVHVLHAVFGNYLRSLAQSTSSGSRKEMAADVKFAEFATLCTIDDALADASTDDGAESSRMNVTTLKSLTGGGLNFARGVYDSGDGQRELTMNLLFTGNTLMNVSKDRGVYNRLKNIPFTMRFLDRKGENRVEYDAYMNESYRAKVVRIQTEMKTAANNGTAFDAGQKLNRDRLGSGLAIIFGTIAMHYPASCGEDKPAEVHHNYTDARGGKRRREDDGGRDAKNFRWDASKDD